MTVKFSRTAANTYYSAPDDAGLTIPASPAEWCMGFVLNLDGLTTGDNPQYIISTKATATAGAFNVAYLTDTVSTAAHRNKIVAYFNTLSTPTLVSVNDNLPGSTWLFVLQHSGSDITIRRCPILSSNPTDGSAVVADGTAARSVALDGSGLWIGARANLTADRMLDNSVGRLFYASGTLTDLEVAKLAYGMEITDLGKSPLWYIRLDNADDLTNRGSIPISFTKNGSPTTSASQPAFGYVAGGGTAAPTVTGTPTINGTPQQGTPIGYTTATVGGNPTPTVTQQWTIDGVDISGATASTYTPIAGDVGKALRVRQIATNSVSPAASATSSPATVTAASGTITLTVDAITAHRIFQRASGSVTIPLAFTYGGTTPTSVEYQIYAEDGTTVRKSWTALSSTTISGGTGSGNVIAPQGGMYKIQYRSKSGTTVLVSTTITTDVFGVGDIFTCLGSSSAEKWFNSSSGTGNTPSATVRKFTDGVWGVFGTVGCAIRMANSLTAQSGIPIGLIDSGVGGTTLETWNTTASNYKTAIANAGGKLAGAIISVGSNDTTATSGSTKVLSAESHLAKMTGLADRIRNELTGQTNLPVFWSGMNRRQDAGVVVASCEFVRTAENNFGDLSNSYHIQTLDFELSTDNIHLTPAGFIASGERTTYVMGEKLYGGGTYKRGPKITGITYSGPTVYVTLAHRNGTDFAPTTGITGFTVSDASGAANINSAVRTNATSITLVCDRSLSNAKATYLAGSAPVVGTQVFDNGSTALPMHQEVVLAATDSGSGTIPDTESPVIPGTLSISAITATGFTMTWQAATDNVGVTGYETSADTGTASYSNAGNVLTRVVAGLDSATAYTARVRAYDAAGNRSVALTASATTSAGPDITAPNLVGSITVSNVGTSGFTFAWPAATDNIAVTGYEYSVDTGAPSYVSNGTTRTKTVSDVASDTFYTLRVRAFDAAGNRSTAITTTVRTDALPVGPSLVPAVKNTSAPILITPTVLTTSQLLVNYSKDGFQDIFLYNKSASNVVVTIRGSSATTLEVPKAAGKTIDLTTGIQFTVNANSFSVFKMENAKAYFSGDITISASVNSSVSACLVS